MEKKSLFIAFVLSAGLITSNAFGSHEGRMHSQSFGEFETCSEDGKKVTGPLFIDSPNGLNVSYKVAKRALQNYFDTVVGTHSSEQIKARLSNREIFKDAKIAAIKALELDKEENNFDHASGKWLVGPKFDALPKVTEDVCIPIPREQLLAPKTDP